MSSTAANSPGGSGYHEAAVDQLIEAGFDRHAAEVALASANGDIDRAATLILSWGNAEPPPVPSMQSAPLASSTTGTLNNGGAAGALRIRMGASAIAEAESGPDAGVGGLVPALPPLPPAGPVVPSLHASEADARQRVFNKQRVLDAKHAKQLRGEAKRRREQELAIWKEQRDDAKLRKGGSRVGVTAVAAGAGAEGEGVDGREQTSEIKAAVKATVTLRLPDGTTVTHAFQPYATLTEVVAWLHATEPDKLDGKDLELRCLFPPPGRAVRGSELDEATVESVGLVPRGRLMVQFSGATGVKQGKGAMEPAGRGRGVRGIVQGRGRGRSDSTYGTGRGRGGFGGRGGGGGDGDGLDSSAVGAMQAGRGGGAGRDAPDFHGGRGGPGRGAGPRGGAGNAPHDGQQEEHGHPVVAEVDSQAGGGDVEAEDNTEEQFGLGHGGVPVLVGSQAVKGEAGDAGGGDGGGEGEDDGNGVADEGDSAPGGGIVVGLNDSGGNDAVGAGNEYGHNQEAEDQDMEEAANDDDDDDGGGDDDGGVGIGVGGLVAGYLGAGGGGGVPGDVGLGPPSGFGASGFGHVLHGTDGGQGAALGGGAGDGFSDGGAVSETDRVAAMRQQRLARLAGRDRGVGGGSEGRGGGGGGGGGDHGIGGGVVGDGAGGEGPRARSGSVGQKTAEVASLQDLLVESICQRIKVSGHQVSYGALDGGTGGRILQRLADMKVITASMLSAFRGCPVPSLTLDKNPRTTNALLTELGRKVSLTSLTLAHCDAVTQDGIESLKGLRALVTLDISGCKATNGWMKAIAKLPALEKLVLRGCTKVADLGILCLSRGAPSLTSLDLTACISVTDAGVAHLSAAVTGAERRQGQEERELLQELRLDGLPELSDDGLDGLCALSGGAGPAQSKLRSFSVVGCPKITDSGVVRVCECFAKSLRELEILATSATELALIQLTGDSGGDRGGFRLGRRMRLQKISLPMYGRGITGQGLRAITESMVELTSLDLEGCNGPGVTSQALSGISRLVELRSLSLCNVQAFDDAALSDVCSACTNIHTLNLNGTGVVLADGLALLGAGVKDLSLGHTNVNDDTMDAVASLAGLTTLTLRGTKVTGAGVARLSCLTNLRSLNLASTYAAREADGDPASAVEALRRSTAALNIRL